MSFTVTIGGNAVNVSALSIQDTLDQRSTANFTVEDATGTSHFVNGQQVTITDSVAGLLFTGYVSASKEKNLYPQVAIKHTVTCIDQRYLADKRVASGANDDKNMSGKYAGDDVVYLVDNYLKAEGVTASYAQQLATTSDDFGVGVLSGVSPAANVDDGDLELAPAGKALTTVTDTNAGWTAGSTLTSVVAANNQLVLKSRNGIALAGDCNGNQGNGCYVFWQIWTGSYVIQSGDLLTYKVWVNKSSPQIMASMDAYCSDGTTFRDFFTGPPSSHQYIVDQNGVRLHPSTDLSGLADNQWYYRYFDLTAMAGKTVGLFTVSLGGSTGGHYAAYFFDCKVTNGVSTPVTIYNNDGILNSSRLSSDIGYSNLSITTPLVYDTPGTRISTATSLTPVGIANSGIVAISETVPTNTSVEVDTSFDGGATWQQATDRQAMLGLIPGASLNGINFMSRQVLTITGDDPTVTPALSSLAASFTPSYAATKHDSFNKASATAQWNALGTNISGVAIGNQITLNNQRRNWDDASVSGQTLYGGSNPFHGTSYKQLKISTSTGFDVRSRLDFAGTWNNFTMSVDVQVPDDANQSIGPTYRTTNWGNGNNTGGWVVDLYNNQLKLGYGDNSGGAGTATYTNVATFNPASFAPASGSWHTLTVIVNGTNHQVWLDGVKYIDVTNSTYSGNTGYVAMHGNDASGTGKAYFFDNFGIGNFLTGIYETNNISLNTLATVGESYIAWQEETLPAGCSLLVQSTIDGGSTFQTCTNGAEIPLLVPGANVVGKNLRVKVTLTAPSVASTPTLDGLMIWVTSSYSSSGSRISPALSLSSVGVAGSTLVSWNALVAAKTTLDMDTSLDRVNWTHVGSGAQGGVPIAGINAQPDPIEDTFDADTSSFYTSTSQTDGTQATWTWNTTNSRLEASGGTTAFLLYSSMSDDDVDLIVDMNTSDAGGLVWRVKDTSNFYDLVVCDSSSASPNQMILYRVANNTRATLLTVTQAWTRGTPHRIRVTMIGPLITVYFDGAQVMTYTDTQPLPAGACGLRNNTFGGQSAANFYFFRIQQQGDNVLGTTVFTRARLTSTDPTVTPQLQELLVSVRSPAIGNGAFIPSTTYSVLNGSTNTIAQNCDDLARQSNYWTRICYDPVTGHLKEMFFQPHNGMLAPFILTGNDIHFPWGVSVENSGDLYRNTPWILGGTDTVLSDKEQFPTDGFTQSFTVKYPIDSLVSLSAGAQVYTFGIQGVDTLKDFYFQQGGNTISQDASGVPLPPGLTFNPVYYGQVNVVASVSNDEEIANRAILTGTSGIDEVAETAPGLNRAAAQQLAASREIVYTPLPKTLVCTTPRIGLAVGQLLSVFLAQHALADWQGLITDMATTYRVDSSRGVLDAVPYFTLTATSGPVLNGWATTLAQMGR